MLTTPLLLLFAGCTPEETDPVTAPIELGTVFAETGDDALDGISLVRGAQLAVDHINAAGGLLGRPVTLINEDDVSDGARAAQAARVHSDADRAGFVGATNLATSLQAADVAIASELVMINSSVPDAGFAAADNGYVIRTVPPEDSEGIVAAARLDQTGQVNVAVLHPPDSALADRAVEAMEDLQLTVVADVTYTDAASLSDALDVLDQDAPDAGVYFIGDPADGMELATALQSWPDASWSWLLASSLDDEAFTPESFPEAHEGLRARQDGPGWAHLRTAFESAYGAAPTPGQARTYDAAILLALGIQAAGNERGDAVRDRALQSADGPLGRLGPADLEALLQAAADGAEVDYEGAGSPVDLDENGDTVGWFDIWELDQTGPTVTVPGFRAW